MKIKDIKCPDCKGQDMFGKRSGSHLAIRCRNCGKWIKWADKNERQLLKAYGQHKTLELDDIVKGLERIEKKIDQILAR